jgi:hypothetical protein
VGYRGAQLAEVFPSWPAERASRRIAEDVGDFLVEAARKHTPVDTGALRASWQRMATRVGVTPAGLRTFTSGAETDVEYAPHLEWGTGLWGPKKAKYPIRPKKPDGWLHWVTPEGEDVFAKLVMHPGVKPRHMVAQALAEAEAGLAGIGEPGVQEWLRLQTQEWNREAAKAAAEVRRGPGR